MCTQCSSPHGRGRVAKGVLDPPRDGHIGVGHPEVVAQLVLRHVAGTVRRAREEVIYLIGWCALMGASKPRVCSIKLQQQPAMHSEPLLRSVSEHMGGMPLLASACGPLSAVQLWLLGSPTASPIQKTRPAERSP